MDKRGQIRWVIIAALLIIIAALLYYPEIARSFFGRLADIVKPITGYAAGAAEKIIQNMSAP